MMVEASMSRFVQWAQKEHRLANRIAATLLAGLLFAVALPLVVVRLGPKLDRLLHLPTYRAGAGNFVTGGALVAMGLFFAIWSIIVQLVQGRGTPIPVMPTQELLTKGPFRCCRNPMSFGTIVAYLGLGVVAGTIGGVGIVLLLSALLILYLRRIEEGELAERFGEGYLAYKQAVPFIIPRFHTRG
jgi:protein-S-isoprenylcysteine O-methyltransferase Ste14